MAKVSDCPGHPSITFLSQRLMKKRKQDTRDTTAGEEKVIGKDGERNDDHYLLPHAPDKNKQEINRVAGNG